MLKTTTILLIYLFSSVTFAQEEKWDQETLHLANNGDQLPYLTQVEKDVIYYSNLVRINPVLFEKTFLLAYIKNYHIEQSKWTRSCRSALRKTKPMKRLTPKEDLYKAAKKHAHDMGKTGKTGHVSSKGVSFDDRFEHLRKSYDQVYENCNYGFDGGLSIVCDLLIDEGVEDAGHRKTILNSNLHFIGTSVQPHKEYGVNCVQDFGA